MQAKTSTLLLALCGLFNCGASAADELRVGFADTCPLSGVAARENAFAAIGAAILADFGGRIVGGLIDQIGAALSEDKVVSFESVGRMQGFYNKDEKKQGLKLNTSEGCLIIVIGEFGGDKMPENLFPKAVNPRVAAPAGVTLAFGNLKGPPKLYIEGVFEKAKDESAFAFEPTYVYYPAFLSEGTIFSSSQRDLLVRVEWSKPGEEPFAAAQLTWTAVSENDSGVVIAKQADLAGKKTAWFKAPDFGTRTEGGRFGATNVKVLVSETAKPYTLAKYLGEALKGQKEQITTATKGVITQSVSTEARLEAKLKLNETAQAANTVYVTAYDDAQKAFDAWNDEKDPAAKPSKLNAARLAYQKVPDTEQLARRAYANAGLPFESRPALKPLP